MVGTLGWNLVETAGTWADRVEKDIIEALGQGG